jgi:signal transduction histidine kinase
MYSQRGDDEDRKRDAGMTKTETLLARVWKWWFTLRSSDPTVSYRERALRFLLPVMVVLRILALASVYSGISTAPPRYFPAWIAVAVFVVPISLSFRFLLTNRVDWAGVFFLTNWFLMDILNLPADGYWNAGFQVSLIIQVVLAALLLPSRVILPFLAFQLVTFGLWGYWLDIAYYDPPLLSSGQPVADFLRTIITLAVQEAIILFIVRYLRLEMEKSLRLQQTMIAQLEDEITERSRMEKERENFIRELNEKNIELERFTYTVSHDLKSPLVTIKGFLGLLKNDLEKGRRDLIQKDFSRIAEAAEKMGVLLSELLELSRIGRIVNLSEKIDVLKLIQESLETLDARIQSRHITVMISPNLPMAYADRIRLREVLENLIDNAAKYMGDQPRPLIEIGGQDNGDEAVFYVKDNGIGIEPRYQTRIFGLFDKLDATAEGTGVGLAIVKRVVELHGGRIWVESEGLGKGSTFYFVLPASGRQNMSATQAAV